ncbi:hypothetical protein LZ012_17470 [Dechloromonas sp. XY25]|uniref:Uncharacterized protein n=1 Tax=Dechloromonas hankyongensis TaxID=2908002 RepID=A0ABS9K6J5_9RHOO|nr:hypothetical protein [Dechloromonas hankyongensis]MCG2578791.1 hypothetical protein [Dechloromonas hankyongensis]
MIAKARRATYPGGAGFTDIYDWPAKRRSAVFVGGHFFPKNTQKQPNFEQNSAKTLFR